MTYKLETIGATLRIVDEDGRDVALLGRADDWKVRAFAGFAIEALNAHELTGHYVDSWQRRAQEA